MDKSLKTPEICYNIFSFLDGSNLDNVGYPIDVRTNCSLDNLIDVNSFNNENTLIALDKHRTTIKYIRSWYGKMAHFKSSSIYPNPCCELFWEIYSNNNTYTYIDICLDNDTESDKIHINTFADLFPTNTDKKRIKDIVMFYKTSTPLLLLKIYKQRYDVLKAPCCAFFSNICDKIKLE